MVNLNIVTTKLAELAHYLDRARSHCPASVDDLASNRDALDIVAFNMMLAVQACTDIASHMIADEGWRPANTMAASFARLAEQGVLSTSLARTLGRAVGLRNIVAHGYAGVDVTAVYNAATTGLADLEKFAASVAAWIQRSPPSS